METRPTPYGAWLLCLVAFGLYVGLLVNALQAGGSYGEAAFGDAIASLLLVLGLWIVLAVLLLVGGIMGQMPRWAAILAVPLHLFSGVAATIALDMCSRHMKWAVVFLVLTPLLTALYAMWARLPYLHERFPAEETSIAAWGAIFVLSVAPSVWAYYY